MQAYFLKSGSTILFLVIAIILFRVGKDALLDLFFRHIQRIIALPAVGMEQFLPKVGVHFPLIVQAIHIALGDAAQQVSRQVLNIFLFLGVDVAGDVEVELIFLDFGVWRQAGISGNLQLLSEYIDDLVDVLLAQPVFVAVLHEPPAGVDHKNRAAGAGIFLVQHNDASRDARAIKQVGRQADDAFDIAPLSEPEPQVGS